MKQRNVVIAVATVGMLAAGGGAYAATQTGGTSRQAFLNDAAHRLNVSPAQLQSALRGAYADRLDAAVAAGKLTPAQANALKRRGPLFERRHGFFGRGVLRGGLAAAESYLHLSGPQIRAELRSGKSLAQIAAEHGKSADGLTKAIEDGVRAKLDAAVKANRLTSAQEQRIVANLDARIGALVNRSGGAPLGRMHHHRAF